MTQPTNEEISHIHAQTRGIGAKLSDDPAMRAQYLADPVGSLTIWGLPPAAARELAAKIAREQDREQDGDEVSGYAYDSSGVYYHDMLDDYGIHINWSF